MVRDGYVDGVVDVAQVTRQDRKGKMIVALCQCPSGSVGWSPIPKLIVLHLDPLWYVGTGLPVGTW